MADAASKTIVLITGANRGIGYEIASALLRSPPVGDSRYHASGAPYHVILTARSSAKGEAALATLEPQHGSSVSVLEIDVVSPESIAAARAKVEADFGRIDVLVNNAGIVATAKDAVDNLRQTLETNTIGPFAISEAFKGLLTTQPVDEGSPARKDKRMIVVSSDLGSLGLKQDPGYQHRMLLAMQYRMSKAAVDMMTLNYHVHEPDFKSFAWTPGWTATGLTGNEEERKKLGANDPKVVAEGFKLIVEGQVDAPAGTMLDENLKVLPW